MSVPPTPPSDDRDALVADIEQTRVRLAATADALAAKADVKAQAQHKVDDLKATVAEKKDQALDSAQGLKAQAFGRYQEASDKAPGSPKQQNTALLVAVVAVTTVAVWLVLRKKD
jgi:ABC-type Na+ efflux pump permease subunit